MPSLYANKFRGDDVFVGAEEDAPLGINESDQVWSTTGYRVGHQERWPPLRAVIYNRPPWFSMLRLMVGDEVFFNGIKRFYLSSRFRKVGSEDFRFAMQEESGRDLQRFFER
jgi:hypothetical protein